MARHLDIHTATSRADLTDLSKEQGGLQVTAQLEETEIRASASRWTRRHLIAYRLITRPEDRFLSSLEHERCPICNPHDSGCTQSLRRPELESLIREPTPQGLHQKTESELMRYLGGIFWVALARASSPEITKEAKLYPQRIRKSTEREGFVNSTVAIPGSSSPGCLSSSEFEISLHDIDEDEHDSRRRLSEEVTVHLMRRFLEFTLSCCLVQADTDVEIRPRIERRREEMNIIGNINVIAEDDGGLCRMIRQHDGWTMDHAYMALLEAKKAFKYLHYDEGTDAYIPVLSNENLAQYLGEAVVTWQANRELLHNHVFLIAATTTFVRFVHFEFGKDYSEYLGLIDERLQKELVDDEDKDSCVYMSWTRGYNLQSREGRKATICHILALLRWHEEQDVKADDSPEASEQEESGSAMSGVESADTAE